MPPMTPPTMAPTGVAGAAAATGGVEDVASPERAVLVGDSEVVGASVLEAASEEVEDVSEDVSEEEEEVLLDLDVDVDLEVLVGLVEVEVVLGPTDDSVLPFWPLKVVWALRMVVVDFAPQK